MTEPTPGDAYNWPFEPVLHEVFPALHEAQSSWLSQIDSLRAPDRKTHELIRLACTVILRNPLGVRRHAMLAREVGAGWDEVVGAIWLTCPGFGVLPAIEALEHARAGFDSAPEADNDLDDNGDSDSDGESDGDE
jgi:alkylhydroperoxidase/carboxymuconolactone decarboxylase family protein YurZ